MDSLDVKLELLGRKVSTITRDVNLLN